MLRELWGGVTCCALLLTVASCTANLEQLRDRASYDLGCPREELLLSEIDDRTYGVDGCGQRVTYVEVCEAPIGSPGRRCTWALNTDSRPIDDVSTRPPAPGPVSAGLPASPQQRAAGALPKVVAGFPFDASPEENKTNCTEGGNTWEETADGSFTCSGTPDDIGIEASARLEYCDGSLGSIKLVVPSTGQEPDAMLSAFRDVKKALERKYGRGKNESKALASDCEANLWSCIASGKAALSVRWRRRDGRIHLSLGKGSEEGVALRIRYSQAGVDCPEAPPPTDGKRKGRQIRGL